MLRGEAACEDVAVEPPKNGKKLLRCRHGLAGYLGTNDCNENRSRSGEF